MSCGRVLDVPHERGALAHVLLVTSRYTLTGLDWPIRCARACPWRSPCGFQSLSKMTTVSAAVRLMPCPPARVVSRKAKQSSSA